MSRGTGTGTPINWRRPGYNNGGYGDDPSRQLVFHHPLSLHAAPNVSRGASTTTTWNPWQTQGRRVATRPSNISRFSEEQVLISEYGMIRDEANPTPRAREDFSENEQQNKAVNKLRKEIYNPVPKNITRRVSLYYRSHGRNNNLEKEEGKKCVVCLEDFVAREVVMVTPCNHMFHEECIVPWVKTRGQCPVCRFTMGEKQCGQNQSGSTVGAAPPVPAVEIVNLSPNDLFATELISIVRAMEEAFLSSNFR